MSNRPKRRFGFFAWLKRQVERNDPVGDCARDAVDDPAAPRHPKTPRAVRRAWKHYLAGTTCYGVMEAIERAVTEWEQSLSLQDEKGRIS